MKDFLRRLRAALTHSGPGYDLPTTAETDLRATLADLAQRWEAIADRAPRHPVWICDDPLGPVQRMRHDQAVGYLNAARALRAALSGAPAPEPFTDLPQCDIQEQQ